MLIRQAVPKTALFVPFVLTLALAAACGGKKTPVLRPTPPPGSGSGPGSTTARNTPTPPEPVAEPTLVPTEPLKEDAIASGSLDDINRNSPLKPLFFEYDSSDITAEGRATLDANAAVMKRFATWTVTVEGHCDERGTAEYNLALGERRAVAAREYLVSLGISADRLRTVSYGKEFPFEPGHDEGAYTRNRRAHFVITAK